MYIIIANTPAKGPKPTIITKITAHNKEGIVLIAARIILTGITVFLLKIFLDANIANGKEISAPNKVPRKDICIVSKIEVMATERTVASVGIASLAKIKRFGMPSANFIGLNFRFIDARIINNAIAI